MDGHINGKETLFFHDNKMRCFVYVLSRRYTEVIVFNFTSLGAYWEDNVLVFELVVIWNWNQIQCIRTIIKGNLYLCHLITLQAKVDTDCRSTTNSIKNQSYNVEIGKIHFLSRSAFVIDEIWMLPTDTDSV